MGRFARFALATNQKPVSQRVPSVPLADEPQFSAILAQSRGGTRSEIEVSQGVPCEGGRSASGTPGTSAHPPSTQEVSRPFASNNNKLCDGGTPGTLGTPALDKIQGTAPATWDATDWREFYAERAGIAEFDGELSRPEAEARAWECSVAHYLHIAPPILPDGDSCPVCARPLGQFAVPVLRPGGGHLWLHTGCVERFNIRRRVEARRELEKMGLSAPTGWAP